MKRASNYVMEAVTAGYVAVLIAPFRIIWRFFRFLGYVLAAAALMLGVLVLLLGWIPAVAFLVHGNLGYCVGSFAFWLLLSWLFVAYDGRVEIQS